MNNQTKKYYLFSFLLFLLLAGTACNERDLLEDLSADSTMSSEFWYTRQLTKAQQLELQKNFGLGFSYNAIEGSKADLSSVRCQVLNITELDNEGQTIVNTGTHSKIFSDVSHSFSEYCQVTNVTGAVSGDVLIYKKDYSKVAAIYEHAMDTTTIFTSSYDLQVRESSIDTTDINELIKQEPSRFLTPSFLFAIEKLKNAKESDILVVDSFIEIFGTHVVCDAKIGAKLNMDVRTRRADIHDYKSEQLISKEKMNLLFKKTESSLTQTEQSFLRQVLNNSTIDLKVKGGNTSIFNGIISNPTSNNPFAKEETLNEWIKSIKFDANNSLDSNVELIDMKVAPIWIFIPDDKIAKKVESRVKATAPTMQELYGNRNWINAGFNCNINTVYTWVANRGMTKTDNPWICNVVAANRYIATICREWIPEIDENNSVCVAYPIYENKVDLTSGLCIHNSKVYEVAWRYNQFVVKKIEDNFSGNNIYISCGCLSTSKMEGVNYISSNIMLAYEWPGSINIDGNIGNAGDFLTIRKFLGDFYLENDKKYENLPNWTYSTEEFKNSYYGNRLQSDVPYKLSGVQINGKKGIDNLKDRMVRNFTYIYYINKNEAWYE